jgi:hypothetical protein
MAESNQNAQWMMTERQEKDGLVLLDCLFAVIFLWRAIWDSDLSESCCCFNTNGSFVIGLACLSRNGVA